MTKGIDWTRFATDKEITQSLSVCLGLVEGWDFRELKFARAEIYRRHRGRRVGDGDFEAFSGDHRPLCGLPVSE